MIATTRITYTAYLTRHADADIPPAPYGDFCPIPLASGLQVNLPIEPLPGTDEAIVLLMSNQTPFEVEAALSERLTELAAPLRPEAIVGVPTMGLDYARQVALRLGLPHYVACGISPKYWYDPALSVPISSITSPGAKKRLYLDPSLVERVKGKRTLIVDDVVATGGSAFAAISLMRLAGANLLGLAAPFVEGDDWKALLGTLGPEWPRRIWTIAPIPRLKRTPGGWIPAS